MVAFLIMSAEQLIRVGLLLSVVLIVLGFGLHATWRDATFLFRNLRLLLRSLLAMNVIMPLFALFMAAVFALRPAVEIALIALAISPVPPFLPLKQLQLRGRNEYVYGLLGGTALLTIVIAPLTVALIGLAISREARIAPAAVARIVGLTVLVPLAVGLVVHGRMPTFAERASPLAGKVGSVLLIVAFVPVLIKMGPAFITLLGKGTLVAILGFILVGLAVGHLLGGPDPDDRSALALATAIRHPGVAFVIAAGTFPDEKLVAPAVILYVIVGAIASAPYAMWRKRLARAA
jgi:BASS family bile acid:Na+ symporter